MAGSFGLVYPPWNYTGKPDDLLERAVGEVGLTHVTIPVVTGEITQFRLGRLDDEPCFYTEGGWHFPPNSKLYAAGRVRPPTAKWLGKRDVLKRICELAREHDLSAFFRLDIRSVRHLTEQAPHLRQKNAWGQDVSSAPPCIFNPELRELLSATFEDLGRYEPDGLQLQNWSRDSSAESSALRTLFWKPPVTGLQAICFCPACRQLATSAGADPDQAARSVCVHLAGAADEPLDPEAEGRVDDDEVINAYLSARAVDNREWLAGLVANHPNRLHLRVRDYPVSIGVAGTPTHWSELCRPPLGVADLPLAEWLCKYARDLNSAAVSVPTWRPSIQDASQLVRLVSEVAGAGVTFFDFEGLDETPAEAITWLKQAVRYARRG